MKHVKRLGISLFHSNALHAWSCDQPGPNTDRARPKCTLLVELSRVDLRAHEIMAQFTKKSWPMSSNKHSSPTSTKIMLKSCKSKYRIGFFFPWCNVTQIQFIHTMSLLWINSKIQRFKLQSILQEIWFNHFQYIQMLITSTVKQDSKRHVEPSIFFVVTSISKVRPRTICSFSMISGSIIAG